MKNENQNGTETYEDGCLVCGGTGEEHTALGGFVPATIVCRCCGGEGVAVPVTALRETEVRS